MKKIHKLPLIAALGLGLGLASCSDYLNVERYFKDNQSEEKIFNDKQYSEQWLSYCYNRLVDSNLEYARIYFTMFNYSDDIVFNESDGDMNYSKFKFGEYDYGWTWGSYFRCYEGTRQATIFINNIDGNEDLTQEEITDMKGQARFLRAYFYWLLLRKYGPVPIVPEPIAIDETYEGMSVGRSTYDEVAEYISSEMVQAAKELPDSRDNLNIARPTRGAALAVRAKALLYAASPINNPGGPADGDPSETFPDFVDDQGRQVLNQTYDESRRPAARTPEARAAGGAAGREPALLRPAPLEGRAREGGRANLRLQHLDDRGQGRTLLRAHPRGELADGILAQDVLLAHPLRRAEEQPQDDPGAGMAILRLINL